MQNSSDLRENFPRLLKNYIDFLSLVFLLEKKPFESRKELNLALKFVKFSQQEWKEHSKVGGIPLQRATSQTRIETPKLQWGTLHA